MQRNEIEARIQNNEKRIVFLERLLPGYEARRELRWLERQQDQLCDVLEGYTPLPTLV